MPLSRAATKKISNRARSGIGLSIEWQGLRELHARLETLAHSPEPLVKLARAAYTRGTAIMGISKQLVPVDTGALRSTGEVSVPKIWPNGRGVSVELTYGGPAAPYARIVHEDLEARHRVGQAKYLEEPFLAERDGVIQEFAILMRELIADRRAGRA